MVSVLKLSLVATATLFLAGCYTADMNNGSALNYSDTTTAHWQKNAPDRRTAREKHEEMRFYDAN